MPIKLDDTKSYIRKFEKDCRDTQFPIYMARLQKFSGKYFQPGIDLADTMKKLWERRKVINRNTWKSNKSFEMSDLRKYLSEYYNDNSVNEMIKDKDFSYLPHFMYNILDNFGVKKVMENCPQLYAEKYPANFKPHTIPENKTDTLIQNIFQAAFEETKLSANQFRVKVEQKLTEKNISMKISNHAATASKTIWELPALSEYNEKAHILNSHFCTVYRYTYDDTYTFCIGRVGNTIEYDLIFNSGNKAKSPQKPKGVKMKKENRFAKKASIKEIAEKSPNVMIVKPAIKPENKTSTKTKPPKKSAANKPKMSIDERHKITLSKLSAKIKPGKNQITFKDFFNLFFPDDCRLVSTGYIETTISVKFALAYYTEYLASNQTFKQYFHDTTIGGE